MQYIESIKLGVMLFPFVALMVTIPFVFCEYRKKGFINNYKALVLYSFVLYLICAYFLVVFPLPDFDYVKTLTTPRMQLIPFRFVIDFMKHSGLVLTNIHTYLNAIKSFEFIQPFFNVILTIPFGFFLRYYFKCDLKKTTIYSFIFSLFFELTQLSGLYFIYPRSYRLFDIDDLFLNTIGGIIGFFGQNLIIKVIPDRSKLEIQKTTIQNRKGKRILVFITDVLIYQCLTGFSAHNSSLTKVILFIIYFAIMPLFLNKKTIANTFFNIDIKYKNKLSYFIRSCFLYFIYIIVPDLIIALINYITLHYNISIEVFCTISIPIIFVLSIFYIKILLDFILGRDIFYDKWFM